MFALFRSLGTSSFPHLMSSKELALADRIKKGHYTKEDIQRIQTLIENPTSSDYQLFFNNGDVQRKVIKGLIDGTITDHNLLNAIIQGLRLEQCTPQINRENQISLIGKAERKEELHRLMSEQQDMHFLLNFFRDISEDALQELTIPTEETNEAPEASSTNTQSGLASLMATASVYFGETTPPHIAVTEFINQIDPIRDEEVIGVDFFSCFLQIDPIRDEDERINNKEKIVSAILSGQFGTDPSVLIAFISELDRLASQTTQRMLAKAISSGQFVMDPSVQIALANKLSVFTDREAQKEIGLAIHRGCFDTNSDAKNAIRSNLAAFEAEGIRTLVERKLDRSKQEITSAQRKAA